MIRRTAASRLVTLTTLVALAATLVGTTAVQAREGGSSDRNFRIGGDPAREVGARSRTIDVRKLPAATGKKSPYESALRRPDRGFSPATPGPKGTIPPPPVQANSNSDPEITQATAFAGLSFSSGPNTDFEPPDPFVAVGPEHVFQAVNTSFRISDRAGNALQTFDMFNFFALDASYTPGQVAFFDPRIIYDSLHARWIAIEVSFDCIPTATATFGTGYIDIAISANADATGTWEVLSIPYDDAVPDYPGIGTSTDKVVLSANLFSLAPGGPLGCTLTNYLSAEMDAMAWSQLTAPGAVNLWVFDTGNTFFTWRPALQTPATSATVFAVAERSDFGVAYARITGNAAGVVPPVLTTSNLTGTGVIWPFAVPPQPRQPGVPATISNAVDERPTDAVWKNNKLAFVTTYPCDPTGGVAETRDCVRVAELLTAVPATPTLIQDFLLSQDTLDLYTGGIGYALNDDLHVIWTRSSPAAGDYPSSYGAYQAAAAVINNISFPSLLSAGTGTYPGSRWGDYVGVAQDPQVPNAVWQGNEYSAGVNVWATEVTQLQTGGTTFVPIVPVRVLDTRPAFNIGLSGVFAHGVARSWQVAGFGPTIPANAIAVTGNLTVTNQTAGGFVSVTPAPNNNPLSSIINFPVGDNRANNLTIPLNTDGKVSAVYRASAGKTTNLIFDVTGYFVAGSGQNEFKTITPVRAMDTRFGTGLNGTFKKDMPRRLSIGPEHVPASAVAITGNITVVGQTGAGFLSITPASDPAPATSNLNFPLGDNRANGFVAQLNANDDIWIVYKTTASGVRSAHVIVDVTGYFVDDPSGLQFYPLTPGRVMDTRAGAVLTGLSGAFSANTPRRLDVAGHWGVPAGANAITGNLTVVNQTAAGYVSATLASDPDPDTSVLNFPLGDTRANGAALPLNGTGRSWFVYKLTPGKTTHLIFDLSGYFD